MARHAAALLRSPEANAYEAFRIAVSRDRRQRALWVLFGPFFRGPPDRNMPMPLGWAIDLPAMAQTVTGSPMRLLQLPWNLTAEQKKEMAEQPEPEAEQGR